MQLIGTSGRIEIQIPFNAPPDQGCRYFIDDATALDGSGIRVVQLPPADQYQLQGDAFSHAIRHDPPDATALDDATVQMRVIDAIFASAETGQQVDVK